MTRKDFEILANVIKAHRSRVWPSDVHRAMLDQLAEELAQVLKLNNPQFNKEKWLRACMAYTPDGMDEAA